MKRKLSIIMIVTLVVIGFLAWSPWIRNSYAKVRAVSEFESTWLNVADGCGFACHGCGAVEAKKVAFGTQVTLDYACGMLPEDLPEYHQQTEVFVSFMGKVYGLPTP